MQVFNGCIVTCDSNNSVFKYLVESKGKIEYVGNTLPEKYAGIPQVNLGTKALLPSFADTHIHFSSYSLFQSTLDVRSSASIPEMADQLRAYVLRTKCKSVIAFGASSHSVAEKRLITKAEIDSVVGDIPVMIVKYDGHASIINSRLMEELPGHIRQMRGFNKDSGQLNQEAFFATTDHMTKSIPAMTLVKNMIAGVDAMAGRGLGMMHTVEGVGFPKDLDVDLALIFARGLVNPFQSRVFFQTMDVSKVLKRKLPRIGGCFATALDGCYGSEDAALLEPYSNNPSNRGVLFYEQEHLNRFTKEANRAGLQIELHAIGDAAFEQAVTALETALADHKRDEHRHTIIHACLPTKRGLEKVAKLGIGIAVQPAFLRWLQEPLEYVEGILGKRAYEISPLRDMLDMGIHMSGGSDAPCTQPDPIEGIYCACNHYVPGQSLSIPEALKMFTIEGARMSFDEKERGSLETGKTADMVIMNTSPLALKPEELRSLRVEKLILGGKDYKPGQSLPSLLLRGIARKNVKA